MCRCVDLQTDECACARVRGSVGGSVGWVGGSVSGLCVCVMNL